MAWFFVKITFETAASNQEKMLCYPSQMGCGSIMYLKKNIYIFTYFLTYWVN